jgi:hypothetical protein
MRTLKMNQRGRLRRIAAALAAIATAVVPHAARAGGAALPEGIEAEVSGTAPARLLELAHRHPEQVLANRGLRRLRAQDPGVHRDIVLAARCARAEIALAKARAKADEPTLRRFACDCAARVLPLYARFAPGVDPLRRDGTAAPAPTMARGGAAPKPAPQATTRTETFETAIREAEQEVVALEREVVAEAGIVRGARGRLGDVAFARIEQHVARLEDPLAGPAAEEPAPPLRMFTVAMKAAEAIDEASLVAAGGSLRRIDGMCEAIAEAVYLDHAFRGSGRAAALDAVFRELDWQRRHLRAL